MTAPLDRNAPATAQMVRPRGTAFPRHCWRGESRASAAQNVSVSLARKVLFYMASFLCLHTGCSVWRWPRLPRAVGAAAGRSRPPGIVQLRLSSSRGSMRWRSLRVAGPPRTKRGHSGSSGASTATRERQASSPAAGLRGGRLSEWPASPRATWGHPESSDGQNGRWQEAGPAGQDGELTLPGCGVQEGPSRAGLTGSAQQVPTSLSPTSSIRRAGSVAEPQRCGQVGVLTGRRSCYCGE